MKRKKLLLISLDALCESDFETVRNLPNFSKIITEGAYCPHVNAVYPSLTFPCHTSIATGCTPDTHRIVSNYVFDPYAEKPSWNFYASNIKCKAIWDYARESGKRVLSMSWPVSSGAKMTYSRDVPRKTAHLECAEFHASGQYRPPLRYARLCRAHYAGNERPYKGVVFRCTAGSG